jgi:hypothetical protein
MNLADQQLPIVAKRLLLQIIVLLFFTFRRVGRWLCICMCAHPRRQELLIFCEPQTESIGEHIAVTVPFRHSARLFEFIQVGRSLMKLPGRDDLRTR